MRAYELRLIDSRGATVAIYGVTCADDERARSMILSVGEIDYERYELWCGMDRIAQGGRIIMANIPERGWMSLKNAVVLTQ